MVSSAVIAGEPRAASTAKTKRPRKRFAVAAKASGSKAKQEAIRGRCQIIGMDCFGAGAPHNDGFCRVATLERFPPKWRARFRLDMIKSGSS